MQGVMSRVRCHLALSLCKTLTFAVAVVDLAEAGDPNATKFFEDEYQLDHLIATLDTPFVAIMDGITSK